MTDPDSGAASEQVAGRGGDTSSVADSNDLAESGTGAAVDNHLAGAASSALVPLKSLAPNFDKEQHQTYLDRLVEATEDPRNRNIALTGRYGSGKSSVLDEFNRTHEGKTLRLGISTLGPNSEGATLTNRIQKELVKQLLYSSDLRTLRNSRFTRITSLSKRRAFIQAGSVVAALGVLLYLLGWLPQLAGIGPGHHWIVQALVWGVFALLVTSGLSVLRLWMFDRFMVSRVSAGGAAVTLTRQSSTYFDEYLDEIVHYFDTEDSDLVIFEDLDRFSDPHIFEALRELNTLLNNTPARLRKGKRLRFLYAVKDSLFEKLGTDVSGLEDDAAVAETYRANRTKFFDLVIPVVPFISHRNARELLAELLENAAITDIDRRLIDLVAKHATDMRLMVNMRNEYLVFAERLLESNKVAPDLTPTAVFALVAYKSFHLKDFEEISRRRSALDTLYGYHRELVRQSITGLEQQRRKVLKGQARTHSRADLAERLGTRLQAFAEKLRQASSPQRPHVRFMVDSTAYSRTDVDTPTFWSAVAEVGELKVALSNQPNAGANPVHAVAREELAKIFPEALEAYRWDEIDEADTQNKLSRLDQEIAFLRGADFADLAAAGRFTLSRDEVEVSFAELIDTTLDSNLARDLVKNGYLDRNFALYAAQFYGHFTGVDVATFIVQNVQTHTMDIDYHFTSPGAVENLLEEAGEDFTQTVSAYNVDILDYLLDAGDMRAGEIIDQMVEDFDDRAREFLTSYLTAGKQRPRLVAHLASRGRREVFDLLVTHEAVPADVKPTLVDAALLAADTAVRYELRSEVADFIIEHYQIMPAFIAPHDKATARTVAAIVGQAGISIPDLEVVHDTVRTQLVDQELYVLSARNLRAAMGATGPVSLDRVREHAGVYHYCLANSRAYLAAVEEDPDTQHTVLNSDTLVSVLTDVADTWSPELIAKLLKGASPDSSLHRIADAPPAMWPLLADAGLFHASLENVDAYLTESERVDEHLAWLLQAAGTITVVKSPEDPGESTGEDFEREGDEPEKEAVAIALLNARDTIENPEDRVALVRSLAVEEPLPATRLQPEASELFALLLTEGLIEDSVATFSHLRQAGWSAMEPALLASTHVQDFLEPSLLDGLVADFLTSREVTVKLKRHVLRDLDNFVAHDDASAYRAAARFAIARGVTISPDQVRRVAGTNQRDPQLTMQLLDRMSSAPTVDEIVSVLAELGEPYSHLTTRGAREFQVPADDDHRAVFDRLKGAGLCDVRKKKLQPWLRVTLR